MAAEGSRFRPLDGGPYMFCWIDALNWKVREGGRTVNVHCLIASGVNAAGYREILGIGSWPRITEVRYPVRAIAIVRTSAGLGV
jgi:transposase-like protein